MSSPDMASCTPSNQRHAGATQSLVRLVLVSAVLIAAWAALAACAASQPVITPGATTSPSEAADVFLVAGSYTAAEAAYEQALAASPVDPAPALGLADLYLAWSRPAEGLTALDVAVARGAPETETGHRRLALLVAAQDWPAVIDQARTLLLDSASTTEARQALSLAYLGLGRCDEAAVAARDYAAAYPARTDAARISAALRAAYGELADIAPDLMLGLEDCSPDCEREVGLRLAFNGEWGPAVCLLERAISAGAEDAATHVWLGESCARLGRHEDALRHLRLAVDLDPESAQAWVILGTNLLAAGDAEPARVALLNAQKLDPLNPAPCLAVAELKAQMGLYDEVDRWTQAALDRAGEDPEVWKAVARFYLSRRLTDNALVWSAAERASELAPRDAEAHLLVGWAQLLRGNPDAALDALDQAVAEAPTLAEAHHWRGLALEAAGRTGEAADALITAADLGYRAGPP